MYYAISLVSGYVEESSVTKLMLIYMGSKGFETKREALQDLALSYYRDWHHDNREYRIRTKLDQLGKLTGRDVKCCERAVISAEKQVPWENPWDFNYPTKCKECGLEIPSFTIKASEFTQSCRRLWGVTDGYPVESGDVWNAWPELKQVLAIPYENWVDVPEKAEVVLLYALPPGLIDFKEEGWDKYVPTEQWFKNRSEDSYPDDIYKLLTS